MTTPTNWPNPERPGVPLFPERDGWHVLQVLPTALIDEPPQLGFWKADDKGWMEDGVVFHPAQMAESPILYHGPVLTPTQIAEMLAGERGRCAKAIEEQDINTNESLHFITTRIAEVIRNLGDAP
ncbi:hypothetical protein HK15_13015 [Acetobacter orientalis]|uniref:Uncharacterized protein n=1 Tax=Acetobacter orientalis TaxID=146474 RepID=A0A252B316_9PROT|nr:hypothetical protein [Acetobacter orientalis]OUI98768.1 hypothetical protein HK15_13015 [Acetobacter orientalis]